MRCPSPLIRRMTASCSFTLPSFSNRNHITFRIEFQKHHLGREVSTALLAIPDTDHGSNCLVQRAHRAKIDPSRTLRDYSLMLQTCTSRGSLVDGKAVHAHILKSGIDPDCHLWDCLVNIYCKCGSLECARRVFYGMPERDIVAWTALIAGCTAEGECLEGAILFSRMRGEGILPNEFALATGLKACSTCLDLNFGKQVHGEAIKLGFLVDPYIGSTLVDLYVKCGEMELAEKAFFNLPNRNDVSWNALLNGYSKNGCESKVLNMFRHIMYSDTGLSKYILSIVIKCCGSLVDARQGQAVHTLAVKIGSELDCYLSSCLIDMYSKCGLAKDAEKVFLKIKDPDVVAWNSVISCFNQHGFCQEAAEFFIKMRRVGIRPNQFPLASLAAAATELGSPMFCHSVHAYITKTGFENDNSVSNALVSMYMNVGAVHDGYVVFDALVDRDTVSWNALLSGFHSDSCCGKGLKIFNQMLLESFKPNKFTFISVLRCCTSMVAATYGAQVHVHIIKNSLEEDSFTGTALVDMYAKSGCFDSACLVFNRLKERDVFTWTVIITGYSQTDQGEKAIKCYRQMQQEGVRPNEFTFACCLRACSSLASLDIGCQLHSRILKSGVTDAFVSTALVDMYGKCGCLKDAEAVFDSSTSLDCVSWNTMICGYSQHGYGEMALEVFQCMLDEGVQPDEVTFVGVLSACSHAGLVNEGRRYFNSMSQLYGITPTMEHHACMVDILGRAGKLDEVEHFIEKMTLTPNALIWQTILGASKMHGNVEFGEKAAQKLFELEPHADSTYILLSNIYAAAKRWDDVARVRSTMSSEGIKKEPGCSWIDVEGQVHVFLPQDGSHPEAKDIHQKVRELAREMAVAGYVPKTDDVLHNVVEHEKQESLLYHSERLALAYGLIRMKPGKVVRIFKNLRICGDCHTAIKIISSITSREIIIRDISRFHHFDNGSCSCRDYW